MAENTNIDNSISTDEKSGTPEKKHDLARIIVLSVLVVLLIATVVLVALLTLPSTEVKYPVIEVADTEGKWEESGTVAVFKNGLKPGSSGKYEFALKNSQEYEVAYEFSLTPKFSEDSEKYFPIKFRLRMNNVLIETEEWRNVYNLSFSDLRIVPGATQKFTLEWEWPFESGADEKDTYLGTRGETVSMVLSIGAQAAE